MTQTAEGSPERPDYYSMEEEGRPPGHRHRYLVMVREGPGPGDTAIVCGNMIPEVAGWLVEQLQGRPFTPGIREVKRMPSGGV